MVSASHMPKHTVFCFLIISHTHAHPRLSFSPAGFISRLRNWLGIKDVLLLPSSKSPYLISVFLSLSLFLHWNTNKMGRGWGGVEKGKDPLYLFLPVCESVQHEITAQSFRKQGRLQEEAESASI